MICNGIWRQMVIWKRKENRNEFFGFLVTMKIEPNEICVPRTPFIIKFMDEFSLQYQHLQN